MKPYTLKPCLRDLIVGRLKPAKADCARAQFAADRLIEFFGEDRDVTTITRKDIRAYRAKRLVDGVSDSTIRRELGVLKSALNFAAEEELIAVVPAFKLPQESAPRERWLSEDEVVKLMEQPMSDRVRLYISIALGTGARREAITTLPVKRVDLKGGFIDFRDPGKPSTKKRRVKTTINNKWLHPILVRACEGKSPDDLVIGGDPKSPTINSSISSEVKRLLRAIGIDEDGISAHTMRRTFVCWSFLNGASVASVSAATGDNISTLEKSYFRMFPQHTAGATGSIKSPTGE